MKFPEVGMLGAAFRSGKNHLFSAEKCKLQKFFYCDVIIRSQTPLSRLPQGDDQSRLVLCLYA